MTDTDEARRRRSEAARRRAVAQTPEQRRRAALKGVEAGKPTAHAKALLLAPNALEAGRGETETPQ